MQNKTEAKSNTSYHNTNSAETKDSFTALNTSFMSNRQILQVTSVNIIADRFRKGKDIWHIVSNENADKSPNTLNLLLPEEVLQYAVVFALVIEHNRKLSGFTG